MSLLVPVMAGSSPAAAEQRDRSPLPSSVITTAPDDGENEVPGTDVDAAEETADSVDPADAADSDAQPLPAPEVAVTDAPDPALLGTGGVAGRLADEPQIRALQTGTCNPDLVYSVSRNGRLRSVSAPPTGNLSSRERIPLGAWNVSDANALGVTSDGNRFYAIERKAENGQEIVGSVLFYNHGQGGSFTSLANSKYVPDRERFPELGIVAGAVDHLDRFMFGGFYTPTQGNHRFALFRYDAATNMVELVGTFDGGNRNAANGDMAFDRAGNLFVLQGWRDGLNAHMKISVVRAAELLGVATGRDLPVTSTTERKRELDLTRPVNGAAFGSDGTLYLGSDWWFRPFNPATLNTTGGRVGIESFFSTFASLNFDSTDLASCGSPPTLTILKDVVGRAGPSDQFDVTIYSDAQRSDAVISATTDGNARGIQEAQAGPLPVQKGTTYYFDEKAVDGTLDDYISSWRCIRTDTEAELDSGTGSLGSVAIPNEDRVPVECTIRNTPLTAEVEISKYLVDQNGDSTGPGEGWRVGMTATATEGSVQVTEGAATQSTDADGAARWKLRFGSAAHRATLAVSEEEQDGFAFHEGRCVVASAGGGERTIDLTTPNATEIDDIKPGDLVQCAYGNKPQQTTLTLIKEIADGFPPDHAAQFIVWASREDDMSTVMQGRTGTPAVTNVAVEAGVRHTLREFAADTQSHLYVPLPEKPWRCVDQSEEPIDLVNTTQLTLTAGQQATCTVTNISAKLTLLKHVDGGDASPENWALTASPTQHPHLSAVTVAGAADTSESNTFQVRPGHGYRLSEAITADGASLAYQQLRLERLVQSSGAGSESRWESVDASEITVAPGEHATYRFVNAPVPQLELPLTGGAATDLFRFVGGGMLLLSLMAAAVFLLRRRSAQES